MKTKLFTGLLIIFLLFLLFYYFLAPKKIEIVKPYKNKAVSLVYGSGIVEPRLEVALSSILNSARVSEVLVDEGREVKKDDKLIIFDYPEFNAKLLELKSREDLSRREYERARTLFNNSVISKDEFEKIWTAYDVSSLNRKQLEALRENYILRAPFDGKVSRRDVEVGEIKNASEKLLWLSSNDGIRVSAEIDEEDISLLEVGQRVLLKADAFPEQIFEGELEAITERADFLSRSYRIRVKIDQSLSLLKIGMSIEVNVITRETEDAIFIPASSVKDNFVLLYVNGEIQKREVRLGIVNDKSIEILSGISLNDEVVKEWISPENYPIRFSKHYASYP